jgi:hypothetical protein
MMLIDFPTPQTFGQNFFKNYSWVSIGLAGIEFWLTWTISSISAFNEAITLSFRKAKNEITHNRKDCFFEDKQKKIILNNRKNWLCIQISDIRFPLVELGEGS